jgi:ABC-type antimicrobial peptide transport system permease subunit
MSGTVVGAATLAPLGSSSIRTGLRLAGEPEDADQPAWVQEVNTGYFTTLGIPLVAGRMFDDSSATEVMVNETLARRLSPTGEVIGQVLAGAPQRQIVGVVSDARLENLGETHPTIFQPVSGIANFLFTRDIVTTERLKVIVTTLNPRAAVTVRPLVDNLHASLEASQLGAMLTAVIGVLALGLAAAGIAGVFSYVVTERTREIGVRMAIGARKTDVLVLLGRHAMHPLIFGLAGGLLLSAVATPTLRSNIYGLSPYDPTSFALGVLVITVAAVLSTLVPAMRALRIDPAITLRHE